MPLIAVDFKPEIRKLRQFGWVALGAFGLLGAYALWKGRMFGFDLGDSAAATGWSLIALGAVSAVFSVVAPAANRALYLILIVVTLPIGFVLSFVVIGAFFYLIITPFGLFFRLVGRDALKLELDPKASTYWTRRASGKVDIERYFKQY